MYSLSPDATLVQTLMQLGPEITNGRDVSRAILARFGISESSLPRDDQVVEVITTLARLASEGNILCDVGTLVKVLSDLVGSIFTCSFVVGCAKCAVERKFGLGGRNHVV